MHRNTHKTFLHKQVHTHIPAHTTEHTHTHTHTYAQAFSRDGRFLFTCGLPGQGHGQLRGPKGIAVSARGEVFVCDSGNERIQVFSSLDGRWLRGFGCPGWGDGHFSGLRAVAVNQVNGNVVTTEYNEQKRAGRVQILTSSGVPVRVFGDGLVADPRGVSVSEGGDIVVADGRSGRLLFFDMKGDFLRALSAVDSGALGTRIKGGNASLQADGCSGNPTVQLRGPYGVAVGSQGGLVVTDYEGCFVVSLTHMVYT
jgi:hypothetical protein